MSWYASHVVSSEESVHPNQTYFIYLKICVFSASGMMEMNGVVFVAFKELKKKNYVLKNSTAAQVPGTLGNPHTAKRVCLLYYKML